MIIFFKHYVLTKKGFVAVEMSDGLLFTEGDEILDKAKFVQIDGIVSLHRKYLRHNSLQQMAIDALKNFATSKHSECVLTGL